MDGTISAERSLYVRNNMPPSTYPSASPPVCIRIVASSTCVPLYANASLLRATMLPVSTAVSSDVAILVYRLIPSL
jgi:hypothetical protein